MDAVCTHEGNDVFSMRTPISLFYICLLLREEALMYSLLLGIVLSWIHFFLFYGFLFFFIFFFATLHVFFVLVSDAFRFFSLNRFESFPFLILLYGSRLS